MRLPRRGLQITGRWLVALIARWLVAGSEAASLRRDEALSSCEGHPARPMAAVARAVTPARLAVALFAVALFIVALAAFAALLAAPADSDWLKRTASDAEDSGGLNDWRIGDSHQWSASGFSGSGADAYPKRPPTTKPSGNESDRLVERRKDHTA